MQALHAADAAGAAFDSRSLRQKKGAGARTRSLRQGRQKQVLRLAALAQDDKFVGRDMNGTVWQGDFF
jgi:hypothetical protein